MTLHIGIKSLLIGAAALIGLPATMVAAQNWNAEYRADGDGHAVGNPEAVVKLITFVSYTCPHCASFEIESDAALRAAYIHEGKVAVEVRHTIRNPIDLAAALITQCGPKEKFFDNHRRILFAQSSWLPKARQASEAQRMRWSSGPAPARMRAIAADLGFYNLMETRGYSRANLDRCLGDTVRAEAIATLSEHNAEAFGVRGTPSFAINGQLLEGVHNWADLQPAINAALTTGE